MVIKYKFLIAVSLIAALTLSGVAFASDISDNTAMTTLDEVSSDYTFRFSYNQSRARRFADLVNQYRTNYDLTYDYGLEKIAMQRAAELPLIKDWVGLHKRPDHRYWYTAINELYPKAVITDPENGLYLSHFFSEIAGESFYIYADKKRSSSEKLMLENFKEGINCWDGKNSDGVLNSDHYRYFAVGSVRIENDADYYIMICSLDPVDQTYTSPLDSEKNVSIAIREDLLTNGEVKIPDSLIPVSGGKLKSTYKSKLDISSLIPTPEAVSTKYKSSNKKIANVNNKGIVTGGKKAGTATITKYVKYSKKSSWETAGSVIIPNYYPQLPKKQSTFIGSTISMNSLLTGMDELPTGWESSKPRVVSVTSDGTATALSKGSAKLTPIFSSGKAKEKTTINVKK